MIICNLTPSDYACTRAFQRDISRKKRDKKKKKTLFRSSSVFISFVQRYVGAAANRKALSRPNVTSRTNQRAAIRVSNAALFRLAAEAASSHAMRGILGSSYNVTVMSSLLALSLGHASAATFFALRGL